SSLLAKETLPDVKDAFAIISKEESYRGITSSSFGSVTKHQVGHTVDNYFDIIGYPHVYNKNLGPKPNGPRTFNANSVSSSSDKCASLSFTNEHMIKLMNLINEAPSGSVQANMADSGANQHMTISTLNMFGIIDIFDLNLTVGHSNGTLAKVKYVGNLKLSDKIVLCDVLVVPKYYASFHIAFGVNRSYKVSHIVTLRLLRVTITLSYKEEDPTSWEQQVVKKKKEGLDSKLTGFESASKDLDTLLGSQRTDKNKEGLGYSSIMSKPMIKFVKAADSPGVIKTNKTESARKPPVKYAEMYRNTSKSPKVRASVSAARHVNTAAPRPNVNSARPKTTQDLRKLTITLSYKCVWDDAPIKGRSIEIGEEVGVEKSTKRGCNDTEELVNVLTSMDAANILTSGVQDVSVPPVAEVSTVGVPTGSGLVSTVIDIFTTASVVTPYSRRLREISTKDKGKEKMVVSDTPKKKKLQEQIDVQMAREMEEQIAREDQRIDEQIARDAEIARIHVEEELQMMIDRLDRNNEVIAKHLQEYEQSEAKLTIGEKIDLINELVKYQDHHAKILKYQAQQSKPLSKKKQIEFYMSVIRSHSGWKTKHFKDFVPMVSKEKGERVKRKGLKLEQGSAKKIKTSEDVSEEDLKEMMQLVPVEEVYVEALQVKHLIIDWEIHTEGKKDY
nr:hypothetical protein [Tanacetum cinerariifolium]